MAITGKISQSMRPLAFRTGVGAVRNEAYVQGYAAGFRASGMANIVFTQGAIASSMAGFSAMAMGGWPVWTGGREIRRHAAF